MKPSYVACLALAAALAPALAAGTVDDLIARLGSDEYADRQAATRRLGDLPDAEPAVRGALLSPDAEVRRRAGLVLAKYQGRRDRRLAALAAAGAPDLLAEGILTYESAEGNDECWRAAHALVRRVIRLDSAGNLDAGIDETFNLRKWSSKDFDVFRHGVTVYPLCVPFPESDRKGSFLFRGGPVKTVNNHAAMLVSTGPVSIVRNERRELGGELAGGLILSNGPARAYLLAHGVVVCDGDFGLTRGMQDCVVVASGTVRGVGQNCLVLAGGDIEIPEGGYFRNSTLNARGTIRSARKGGPVEKGSARAHDPDALAGIEFFKTADVGVVAETAGGGVRVTRADPGKAFAAAGVAVGDLVTAVDGDKVGTAEEFRRRVRRAVIRERAALTVCRGGAAREIVVAPLHE